MTSTTKYPVHLAFLDAEIPLTSGEWDEWGNPNEKEYCFFVGLEGMRE
jgi:protease II